MTLIDVSCFTTRSGKCNVLIIWRVWFSLACPKHLVCRRFGRFLLDSVEITQNRRQTKYSEHTSEKIRPWKRLAFCIFLKKKEEAPWVYPPFLSKFPNAVVLNAVVRRITQMSAKEHKWAKKDRKRKSTKERCHLKLQTTRFETTRFGNSRHHMQTWKNP